MWQYLFRFPSISFSKSRLCLNERLFVHQWFQKYETFLNFTENPRSPKRHKLWTSCCKFPSLRLVTSNYAGMDVTIQTQGFFQIAVTFDVSESNMVETWEYGWVCFVFRKDLADGQFIRLRSHEGQKQLHCSSGLVSSSRKPDNIRFSGMPLSEIAMAVDINRVFLGHESYCCLSASFCQYNFF